MQVGGEHVGSHLVFEKSSRSQDTVKYMLSHMSINSRQWVI